MASLQNALSMMPVPPALQPGLLPPHPLYAPPGPPVRAPMPATTILDTLVDQQLETQKRLLNLMITSGYEMVQFNGQRRTGPPRDWVGPPPGPGCEIFIGKIPRDLYEDEIFPLLQQQGRLYEMRLMMDFSGTNRGFGFAQYATQEEAREAVKNLDGYAIRPGKYLGVMKSLDNRRLFVGGLPKDRNREEIMEELGNLVSGIVNVILYSSVVDKTKNRGFAFVEFESHRVAAIARRKMIPGGVILWDHELAVDWAEPEPEVPENIMSRVRVLYMRNLMLSTSEPVIREVIEKVAMIPRAAIEKVKKLKDFAFLHFTDRHFAEKALPRLDKLNIEGATVSVVWAKPPRDRVQSKMYQGDSLSTSDEDTLIPRGRPILPCGLDYPMITPPGISSSAWDTLIAFSADLGHQEPPHADFTSWPHPSNPNVHMYLARVTAPFLQAAAINFTGNYALTPQAALDSAAESVFSWMQRNGGVPFLSSPILQPF